jgi:hypothetical protein
MNRKNSIENILKNINLINTEIFLNEIEKNSEHYKHIEKLVNDKNKNWYNKRTFQTNKNGWEFITEKYLQESKTNESKFQNKIFDKIWRSRFGDIDNFNNGYPRNMEHIYVSDYIMFNPKCQLTLDLVDRILPYIKFKKIDSNTIQIDRWIYKQKGFFIEGSNKPNYEITWSSKELDSSEFVKTETDKWLVVRAMLDIMNETSDEFLNFNSYQIIGYWYYKNDSWLVSWEPNNYKNEVYKNLKPLVKSDFIIKLDNKLEKSELINLLYDYSINGGNDLRKIGYTKSYQSVSTNILKDLFLKVFYKQGDLIENISDAKINTVLDLDILDLTNYLEINGEERTRQLISDINQIIKYRFNCDKISTPDDTKITKEKLLARMYNLSLPFGMGIIEAVEKIKSDGKIEVMGIKEAEEILSKKNYIGYLYGIPIKMDFFNFPIVNFRNFEKYNGEGSFIKIIESLEKEKTVNKLIPSKEYIEKEIKRLSN